MSEKKQEKSKYYKVEFDKFIDLTIEIIKLNTVLADCIKGGIVSLEIDLWNDSALPYYMESYVLSKQLNDLLADKINNPTQAEIDYCKNNDTNDKN